MQLEQESKQDAALREAVEAVVELAQGEEGE